ncbi:hypothetical protein BMF94_3403 [Rhodotorula taiwanensis]|uniref:MYND-type domain-containing protein n=1 Tax=Rhodotorula taiwanensis TaxID=741276 RepID=A0A2S5B9L6_9BASI|nr:hypothetical protein BMF94_3403 [Rhodotorula taiwanensis]
MSTVTAQTCALCEAKATLKCSACRDVWYCSAKCQKTAPLSEAEMALLFQNKNVPMPPTHQASFMDMRGRSDSDWPRRAHHYEAIDVQLVVAVVDRMFSSVREQSIMMARLNIKALSDLSANGLPATVSSTAAWYDMAAFLAPAGRAFYAANPRMHTAVTDEDPTFETVLNGYLRALLALSVVTWNAILTSSRVSSLEDSEWYPLLQLHHERVEKELVAATVQSSVKDTLRQANRGRWPIAPRAPGSPPALHP